MQEAHRERPLRTWCVCRLAGATVELSNGETRTLYDSCIAPTTPDEPVCQSCIDAGHPEQPNFDPTIKNARSNQ